MRKWKQHLLLVGALIVAITISIISYTTYITNQMHQISISELHETYSQISLTFRLFAERNWNVLEEWGRQLSDIDDPVELSAMLKHFALEKRTWNYSSMYLFNEDGDIYWVTDETTGIGKNLKEPFSTLYQTGQPIVTSYRLSSGLRKVAFVSPLEPLLVDGIEYTAFAVSYNNETLEDMIGGNAYGDQSDCYVVRSNGDLLLSTEDKTVIEYQMENLLDYLEENAVMDETDLAISRSEISTCTVGSLSLWYQGLDYYMVYRPLGFQNLSIVGVVPCTAVESGMRKIQNSTTILLVFLACCVLLMVFQLLHFEFKGRMEEKEGALRQETANREQMETLANTDNLTGLYNERFFNSFLLQKQQEPEPFALFYMDLNDFKPVNDQYGHDVGDQLLRAVARRLKYCSRSHDYSFRIGGDEFALILIGTVSQQTCQERYDRIKRVLGEPYQVAGHTLQISASCGFATYPADSDHVDQIRILADQRMYEDKAFSKAHR